MTDIAGLYNIPTTPEELNVWSFAHAAHHQDINQAIFEATGISLINYVLDPINVQNKVGASTWADQHQIMHNDMDAVLNYAGFNLTDVDFSDQKTLANWIFLHSAEHQNAADVLEIG
jgi:hypothetical protein